MRRHYEVEHVDEAAVSGNEESRRGV